MVHKTRAAAAAALTLVALTGCAEGAADAAPSHVYSPLPAFSTATPTPTKKPVPQTSSSPSPSSTRTDSPSEENTTGLDAEAFSKGTPAQVSVPGEAVAQAPAPMPGPPTGSSPVQVTERTTSSTTAVTSRTVEGRVRILVTCEGQCMLGDLSAPGRTGADGPISQELLRQALEQELNAQDADRQFVTDDLVEQLTRGEWELTDRLLQDGGEKLVFSAARE